MCCMSPICRDLWIQIHVCNIKQHIYRCLVSHNFSWKCGNNYKSVIFKRMSRNKFMSTSSEIALRRMPQYTFDDKSTLAQIMAWCRQATSHCFSQGQSRFISLYGVTRPLRVKVISWWRHQMETFSASLAIWAGNSPVTGVFPAQRPVSRSFDVFFDLRLNKRLSKQLWGWWFETLSCPLWRHCNIHVLQGYFIGTGEIKRWKIVWLKNPRAATLNNVDKQTA